MDNIFCDISNYVEKHIAAVQSVSHKIYMALPRINDSKKNVL
jgi:hypothetical protein